MSPKFDKAVAGAQTPTNAPIQTTTRKDFPTTTTHEGGAGWERTPQGELFLLAVTNFVSEKTFYEDGKERDQRFIGLVHANTLYSPDWMKAFIPWLRNTANMRSASLVAGIEYGVANGPNRRQVLASSMSRADEPGEAVAYWLATYGRAMPKWFKRGVADAAQRLYTEFSALKYDGQSHNVRMGDVLELTHAGDGDNPLFEWLVSRRHGNKPFERMFSLPMVSFRKTMDDVPAERRRAWLFQNEPGNVSPAEILRRGGMTWEALSGWLQGPMDKAAWEAVIPNMGYMALLRNLRNFDEAGISNEVREYVSKKLTDPVQVAKSRQFPYRFYVARKNMVNDFWLYPLEQAVSLSLSNVPSLPGSTLILVDISPSMYPGMSESDRNGIYRYEIAALFGSALAARAERPTLVAYDTRSTELHVSKGTSIMRMIGEIDACRDPGGGTDTFGSLHRHYRGHDRVIILTDEQAHMPFMQGYTVPSSQWRQHGWNRHTAPMGTVRNTSPDPAQGINCPIYTFNLAGYKEAHLASTHNRYTFGGLTDNCYAMIEALEHRRTVGWPWESND